MSARLWLIIIAGGTIMAIALGLRQALGLYLTPISIDLSIGRETFAFALGLMNLFWGLGAPLTGMIADKYGAGRIVVVAAVCYTLGLLVMMMPGAGNQLILGGTLIGLGMSGAGFSVILGIVGRSAPEHKRGFALGLTSMIGSIGLFVALPYTHVLMASFGWVTSLMILSATAFVMAPLAYAISGKPTVSKGTVGAPSQTLKEALKEACADRNFALLNIGFFVCGFHVAFIAIHLPAYINDAGLATWLGAAALSLIGIGNIIGSFGCGALGDYFAKKNVLSLLYAIRSVIILAFIMLPISDVSVLIFSVAIGLLWLGTVPLTSGLVAQIYGTTYMSTLFGLVFLSHQLGSFLGAWIGGKAYDISGSYDIVWWISIALGLLAALVHWPIEERPIKSEQLKEKTA
ncbi:MAG: MFS transporter [Pseudomonadota bacterium]